jgi:plastocyanin
MGLSMSESRPARRRIAGPLVAATALVGTLLAGAVAPAAAAGPPLTITADMPSANPVGHNWGFNDFFPRALTVPTGSTIQFAVGGPHTATLLPTAVTAAADLTGWGLITTDSDDAALNPNGTIHSQFRVPGILPTPLDGCGTVGDPCTFDGTSVVSSGATFGPPAGPFVVTITASPGTYVFHCRIHPLMEGSLTVVGAADQGTTQAQLASAVSSQIGADVRAGYVAEAQAQNVAPHKNADGSKTWTLSAGTASADGHVAILEMLPRNVHIRSGDSVSWAPLAPNEPHTVTFPGELNSDIVPMCESGGGDVPAVPNHVPPQGLFDFHCGAQPFPDELELGGGDANASVSSPATESDSGIVAPLAETDAFGVPSAVALHSWTVQFAGAAPGTYRYICQIHQGMEGVITVVPGS